MKMVVMMMRGMVVVIVVMVMMLAKGLFEARVSEPEENFLEKFPGEISC